MHYEFLTNPAVFAVEDKYVIIVPVKSNMLLRIKVNDKNYFDHSNGIINSSSLIHKVTVPMNQLDKYKKYTVCYKKIIERKPYFSETESEVQVEYSFSPLEKGKPINIYHVADSHGKIEKVMGAYKKYSCKKTDLLILNGDLAEHSDDIDNILTIHKIASGISGGNIPCIFSRGNHDLRGKCAEILENYTPTNNGFSYYTFSLGEIWGIVLDCGEDKDDSHEAYGNTICCHNFRIEETDFLKSVAEKREFESRNIKYKLVISHIPFSWAFSPNSVFDIEKKIYSEWCRILKEKIKPDLMICGHIHDCFVIEENTEKDTYGQPCPVIVGSNTKCLDGTDGYTGTWININNDVADVTFIDSNGNTKNSGNYLLKNSMIK